MKRFQVFTLFLLFSVVVVSVLVMDAPAQANPEDVLFILYAPTVF